MEGFETASYNNTIVNCVSAVDGYLLVIDTPLAKLAKNVRSYFSGHYQRNGVNIQACCDSNCIFTYFGLSAPGSANDRVAIHETIDGESLYSKIEKLPGDYVVLGDAAYRATEKLVPMYYGHQRDCSLHSNFNYGASSLRMRIEMGFGQMVNNFAILKRPLQNSLFRIKYVAIGIARLHNFCVKERIYGVSEWESDNPQPYIHTAAVPIVANLDERFPATQEGELGEPRNLYHDSGKYSSIRVRMAHSCRV